MSESTFPINGTQKEKIQPVRGHSSVRDFLDLAMRRKWLIVLFVLLGLVVGGGLAWIKKDVYRSSAVIIVPQTKNHERSVPSVGGNNIPESESVLTVRKSSVVQTFKR
jgi:uncharacterized protein involved in exopolysaccharide biosynthesis